MTRRRASGCGCRLRAAGEEGVGERKKIGRDFELYVRNIVLYVFIGGGLCDNFSRKKSLDFVSDFLIGSKTSRFVTSLATSLVTSLVTRASLPYIYFDPMHVHQNRAKLFSFSFICH